MAWRVARTQGGLSLAVVVILGWVLLHNYTLHDYPALRYRLQEPLEHPTHRQNTLQARPTVVEHGAEVKAKPTSHPEKKLDLPEFCDYCGPHDELCQKYGQSNLARALAFEGANARLKRVIRKARRGEKIKIGILGGSVTAGHGVKEPNRWSTLYGNWWRTAFPDAEIQVINGAVPASETSYYMTCFGDHIDRDVNVVVIEMGINDRRFEVLAQSYEYLLRALLQLPSQPAVLNLHILALSFDAITMGGDLHAGIAMYYDTPIVSLRNVLLPHIFRRPAPLPQEPTKKLLGLPVPPYELESYWFTMFHDHSVDLRHINTQGHKASAELLEVFTRRTLCTVLKEDRMSELGLTRGGGGSEWSQRDSKLPGNEVLMDVPRLRLFDKYDPHKTHPPADPICMSTKSTKNPLVPIKSQTHGWDRWAPEQRPDKVYIRATEPGSRIAFKVKVGPGGTIRVTFLRSKTFGMGSVFCWVSPPETENADASLKDEEKGRDKGVRWDGWWKVENINSGATEGIKNVTPSEHILRCELLRETKDPSGGHDFRILAVHAL